MKKKQMPAVLLRPQKAVSALNDLSVRQKLYRGQ
jgi:hypothetical protein